MPSCEKCWADAHRGEQHSVADEYAHLIATRVGENACTPEQQAGPEATLCAGCGQIAVHQYAHVCMACGKEER